MNNCLFLLKKSKMTHPSEKTMNQITIENLSQLLITFDTFKELKMAPTRVYHSFWEKIYSLIPKDIIMLGNLKQVETLLATEMDSSSLYQTSLYLLFIQEIIILIFQYQELFEQYQVCIENYNLDLNLDPILPFTSNYTIAQREHLLNICNQKTIIIQQEIQALLQDTKSQRDSLVHNILGEFTNREIIKEIIKFAF